MPPADRGDGRGAEGGGRTSSSPSTRRRHDSWTATYDNPELYEWLLKHRRRTTRLEGSWNGREPGRQGTVERRGAA